MTNCRKKCSSKELDNDKEVFYALDGKSDLKAWISHGSILFTNVLLTYYFYFDNVENILF